MSALSRVERLTYDRLFGERLLYMARKCQARCSRPATRTFKFDTMAAYYTTVWPRTQLRGLAAKTAGNERRILAVEARCEATGEIVYVLTATKVYRPGEPGKLLTMDSSQYTITQAIEVRYCHSPKAPRNNFRHRGARMQLTQAQWRVIGWHRLAELPAW